MLFVDPTYPYRLTIHSVTIAGDVDAIKIFRFAVLKDELFALSCDHRRSIKVFDVSKVRELDSLHRTTPKLAKVEAKLKRVINADFHFDIYSVNVSIATCDDVLLREK